MMHCDKCGHDHTGIMLAYICIGCPCPETPGKQPTAAIDASQFHAYTDGTDTIIGTSVEEAVVAYTGENPDASDSGTHWEELGDDTLKTIRDLGDSAEPRETKTIREWIDWHIANSPDNFQRLLCSTEY